MTVMMVWSTAVSGLRMQEGTTTQGRFCCRENRIAVFNVLYTLSHIVNNVNPDHGS